MTSPTERIQEGCVVTGSLFNEPMRVDPLPHQLGAIYDYLLKLARVRFLLADDAEAEKTG